MWTQRATLECAKANRTWFGTLTLSPWRHDYAANLARIRLARNGVDLEALAPGEQFAERHREISKEITKYLKRVRKKVAFRYLIICEAHVSGLPHYHILVHETHAPIEWRHLSWPWKWGFSKFKLVKDEAHSADYVCKYLSKSDRARVRASVRYGGCEQSEQNTE
jgi:hypothetical protein